MVPVTDNQRASMSGRAITGAIVVPLWSAALLLLLVFLPSSLPGFLFLNAYVLTLLYALNMRATGDPQATIAILLAVFLTPVAMILFGLRWASGHQDRRRGAQRVDRFVAPPVPSRQVGVATARP